MIVLDTHAWIWFVDDPSKLSRKLLDAVDVSIENQNLYISSISVWEVMLLVSKNRLRFAVPVESWLERCEKTGLFSFIPVDNAISKLSVNMSLHGDPADRFIAATAVHLGARLATKDKKLRASHKVETLW
jgi:PIN domain nuclease of toxin-antitoxin system